MLFKLTNNANTYLPNNNSGMFEADHLDETLDVEYIRFLGDDYIGRSFTGDDLKLPIHYLDRSHGWSTTLFKQKIAESLG